MKTILITKEKEETVAVVFEYENEEQKKYIMDKYIEKRNKIFMIDIDGFCYLQHKKNFG